MCTTKHSAVGATPCNCAITFTMQQVPTPCKLLEPSQSTQTTQPIASSRTLACTVSDVHTSTAAYSHWQNRSSLLLTVAVDKECSIAIEKQRRQASKRMWQISLHVTSTTEWNYESRLKAYRSLNCHAWSDCAFITDSPSTPNTKCLEKTGKHERVSSSDVKYRPLQLLASSLLLACLAFDTPACCCYCCCCFACLAVGPSRMHSDSH